MNNRSPAQLNDKGFTLVELLIVVFILGLMSSVVLFSLPDKPAQTSKEVERMVRVFNMASHQAIASGEPIGWRHSKTGHEFRQYRFGKWQYLDAGPLSGIDRLSFASGITVEVEQETRDDDKRKPFFASKETDEDEKEDVFAPLVVFFPTGSASAAEILISGREGEESVLVDSSGGVTVRGNSLESPF